MRLARRAAMLAAGFAIAAGFGARAEEPAVKVEDFPKVYERIAASAEAQAAYRACPADVWNTGRPFWRRLYDTVVGDEEPSLAECGADPLACLDACLAWKSGQACFVTARVLQINAGRENAANWEALFGWSCALGQAGGCTNRASGVRNGGYEHDPFPDPIEPAAASCLFRSFEVACGADDPWGCTMHGMSYKYGLGVAADPGKARSGFDKSCAIAPDFVACESAKGELEKLK